MQNATPPRVWLNVPWRAYTTPFTVTWGAGDDQSGVAYYDLDVSVDGGSWQRVLTRTTATAHTIGQSANYFFFRLTATDHVSNSAVVTTAAFVPAVTKYYHHGGARVALRTTGTGGSVVYYLHADHLGSATLSTDGGGQVVARQFYHPYGTVRHRQGTFPTDIGFTGQRADESTGLMYYRARYYHPGVGRFVSADTIVPEPGNPQSLNRFAYVLGNPLRYTDPTGHFSDAQLKKWFGDSWRTLFSETWQRILLLAEFGDAVVYGSGEYAYFFIVAGSEGELVAWNINPSLSLNLGEVQLRDIYEHVNTDSIALFRSKYANPGGGPSSDYEWDSYFCVPYVYSDIQDGPTAPYRYRYIGGDTGYGLDKNFPPRWNLGPPGVSSLGYYVEVRHKLAGFEWPSVPGLIGGILGLASGGWSRIVGLAVFLWDLQTYDTSYRVVPSTPTVRPIPTPGPVSTPAGNGR